MWRGSRISPRKCSYRLSTEAQTGSMRQIPIIDTHAHLADAVFDADRDKVLERARNAGIQAVVSVSETLSDAEKNLDLAARFSMLKPAAGLYPSYLDLDKAECMITFIRGHRARLAAIGEVGLDDWVVKDEGEKEIQNAIYRK